MSVNVLAPARMAVAANVSMAANGCRLPLGLRGSGRPKNISYNDGTGAVAESEFINLNLLRLRIGILAM
jgi:hypothetical protein